MAEKSKRILVFTTAYKPFVGGSEMAIENIGRRLPSIFFDIITPRYSLTLKKTVAAENFCVHRLGFGWLADKYLFPVSGFLKALSLMRKNNYQLIHAYQASYGAGAAWLLKLFKPKTKFVLTIQEGKNLPGQKFYVRFLRRLIISKADIISGISNYLVDFVRLMNGKAKTIVIPNGVDLDEFSPKAVNNSKLAEIKENLGLKEDNRLIVTVSRLVPKNGVDILIEAMAKVRDRLLARPAGGPLHPAGGPEVKLLIIGNGGLLKKLKLKAKKLKLENTVVFMGEVDHENLPPYLRIADVFARPSQSEGLGSAFLEAMAVGIPVIGTPVGGIPDFLIDRETGLFCRVDNPDDLADKIIEILTDRELRVKIVGNAQNLVRQNYDWNVIARKFANLYDQVA